MAARINYRSHPIVPSWISPSNNSGSSDATDATLTRTLPRLVSAATHNRMEPRLFRDDKIRSPIKSIDETDAFDRAIQVAYRLAERRGTWPNSSGGLRTSTTPPSLTNAPTMVPMYGHGHREDESRIRMDHGPENFATLRRAAVGLIQRDKSKGSIKRKRKRVTWNDQALLNIIQQAT
jgi:hypothetical protein